MKKIVFAFLPWLFAAFSYKAMAQDETPSPATAKHKKDQNQIITIQTKGDKDATINVQVNGDKVLINGKPISEFKDDDIKVDSKKIIIRDGDRLMTLNGLNNMTFDLDMARFKSLAATSKRTFLGVSTDDDEKGAKVTDVTKASAAEKAGLQKDDIITKIDDKKISGPETLSEIIGSMKPKDEVKVYFLRDGKEKTAKATLQERKISDISTFSYNGPEGYKSFSMPRMKATPRVQGQPWNNFDGNFNMDNFSRDYDNIFLRHQKLGLKIQDTDEGNGVKVLSVEDSSAAALAGLRKDDIITSIGDTKVSNTDEAREQLHDNAEKSSYPVKISRSGSEINLTIKIPKKLKTADL